MKYVLIAAMVAALAVPALADYTVCYSWEDGGTILGYTSGLVDPVNVTGSQTGDDSVGGTYTCPGAYDGDRYLHVAESPLSGTPQAYVAWITGLVDGDVVSASFYGYDITSGSPSMRIWAHYTLAGDPNSYAGSASGPSTYTGSAGWNYLESGVGYWTFAIDDPPTRDGIMVEVRLYSGTTGTRCDYWIDYVCVTAPDHAIVHFPEGVNAVDDATWSTIKALYR